MIPVVVVFTTQIARHCSETAGRHIHNILITMQTVRLGDIASAERMKLPIYWEDLRRAGILCRGGIASLEEFYTLRHHALRNPRVHPH